MLNGTIRVYTNAICLESLGEEGIWPWEMHVSTSRKLGLGARAGS